MRDKDNLDKHIDREQRRRLKNLQRDLRAKGYTLRILPPRPGEQTINGLELEIVPLKH